MEIYLLDNDSKKTQAMENCFRILPEVKVVTMDFTRFMEEYDVQCVVSPANAYGIMDGGYDGAITDYFGGELQKKVQEKIIKDFRGQQPVGTAMSVKIDEKHLLIHVPTMMVPSKIRDPFVIYQCMRVTMMEAMKNNVESVVIPMFGGATGDVEPELIGKMMYAGYMQVTRPNMVIDWNEANREALKLKRYGYEFK